jgi:predicted metal-binding protein
MTDSKRHPIRAAPDWDDVVFVCAECMRRGDDDDDDDDDELGSLRKWLKRELKSRGLKKRLRVVECSCLDLCPKRGVVLARGSELASDRKKLRVHRLGDDPQALIDWLANAPVD